MIDAKGFLQPLVSLWIKFTFVHNLTNIRTEKKFLGEIIDTGGFQKPQNLLHQIFLCAEQKCLKKKTK